MYNNTLTTDIDKVITTKYIRNKFISLYKDNVFRDIGNKVQQSRTLEIQNAHFLADNDFIIRKPNYDYANKEIEWFNSESLNVNDIPGEKVPMMWKICATPDGRINSNYGWCVFSDENYNQYYHCRNKLIEDLHTREAIMIYNRPKMWLDYCKDGMHDFMCCQNQHYFINERDNNIYLDVIVNFRSNDAVFGYCNDYIWTKYVLDKLAKEISLFTKKEILSGNIWWNADSLHIYERHFKFIEKYISDNI